MHPSFSGNAADLYNKYNIDHFQKEEFDNFLDVMSHLVFENPKKAISKFEGNKKSKEILADLLPMLKNNGMTFDKKAKFALQYIASNTANQHKVKMKSNKVSEEIDEFDKQEGEDNPGGKSGGAPLGRFFEGNRANIGRPKSYFSDIPKIVDNFKFLDFIKGSVNSDLIEGKPKVKYKKRKYKKDKDIDYITDEDFALEDDLFFLNLIDKTLRVKLPMKISKCKRDLIVLIDDSGSMSVAYVVEKVLSILNAMFDEVLKGNVRLLVAPFEETRDTLFEVHDSKSVEFFKDAFRTGCGGTTDLDSILSELSSSIKSGVVDGITLSPETNVLIINDGQDYVSPRKMPVTIHCYCLGLANYDLKSLCESSGGEYITVDVLDPDEDDDY